MLLEVGLIVAGFFFGMLAMLFGVGAAPFFLPFFFVVIELPLSAAIGATLIAKVFVDITGLIGFIKHKCISYTLAWQVLFIGIPAAIVGVVLSTFLPVAISLFIFSALLFTFAGLIIHPEHELLFRREDEPGKGYVRSSYGLAHNIEVVSATIGGFFTGLVSSGAGEINNYVFLKKYRMPGMLATGTSVFIVSVLAVIAALGHAIVLFNIEREILFQVVMLLVWMVPAAALGAAMGAELTKKIPDSIRELFVAALFLAIGTVVALTAASI